MAAKANAQEMTKIVEWTAQALLDLAEMKEKGNQKMNAL